MTCNILYNSKIKETYLSKNLVLDLVPLEIVPRDLAVSYRGWLTHFPLLGCHKEVLFSTFSSFT